VNLQVHHRCPIERTAYDAIPQETFYDEWTVAEVEGVRRVLNAGSGAPANRHLHPILTKGDWDEVRLDIDPKASPHLIGSIVDMSALVPAQSFDAIWSSHSLEHLYAHEVPRALSEFVRILKPDGFALITSPDLETVAALVVERGLEHAAYVSPVGPITPHDMLFGHSVSIARGMAFMAHNTGFTCMSLGNALAQAGFAMVLAKRDQFDLWALALMQDADKAAIQRNLKMCGLDMFDEPGTAISASTSET
jgi:SAM-dependent methyltransferase